MTLYNASAQRCRGGFPAFCRWHPRIPGARRRGRGNSSRRVTRLDQSLQQGTRMGILGRQTPGPGARGSTRFPPSLNACSSVKRARGASSPRDVHEHHGRTRAHVRGARGGGPQPLGRRARPAAAYTRARAVVSDARGALDAFQGAASDSRGTRPRRPDRRRLSRIHWAGGTPDSNPARFTDARPPRRRTPKPDRAVSIPRDGGERFQLDRRHHLFPPPRRARRGSVAEACGSRPFMSSRFDAGLPRTLSPGLRPAPRRSGWQHSPDDLCRAPLTGLQGPVGRRPSQGR